MPTNPINNAYNGLVKLTRMAHAGVDLGPLGMELFKYSETESNGYVLMDLSKILLFRGGRDHALNLQAQAIAIQQIYTEPTALGPVRLRLLAIMGPGDLMANTPVEFLLENSDIALDIVYVTPERPLPALLPEHDVLFVAIAQSDENMPLLASIAKATAQWPCPVVNKPDRIALLSRNIACILLQDLANVSMPVTLRLPRSALEGLTTQAMFPVIVRPVDSHAGQGLEKIQNNAELADYLANRSNDEFYLSSFIDYRNSDGLFRKYRIVLIKGKPFLCHLAISEHWMIHYLNAGMSESADKRAEEAQVMVSFDDNFAARHAQAFSEINERVGLDYLGIDCGETPDGKLLIFEIDSCMIVHAMDSEALYPYKQPQMHKVFSAFQDMLINELIL